MIARQVILAGVAALALAASAPAGMAQGLPPGQAPGAPGGSPVCQQLLSQLAAVDQGQGDPAQTEQIRRYEEAANRQQFELDRVVAQSRRAGCEGIGFLSLFGGQSQQCGQLNTKIQQMRANLDQIQTSLQRLRGSPDQRANQRRSIVLALGQNNCGPQYSSAAQPGGRSLFDALFGPGTIVNPNNGPMQSSTFRTLCVRTCDGYYFPISYSTTPEHFGQDSQACQQRCPAAQVSLYTYRNPGEDMSQAVSLNGTPYSQLPNAFRYRKELEPSCSCRAPGQSWAEALNPTSAQPYNGGTMTNGAAPAPGQPSQPAPQGQPLPPPQAAPPANPPASQRSDAAPAKASADASRPRTVRSVGPTFVPRQ